MNDIIFTRLHQRSVIVDHNDEQIKYIFIIIGTDDTINWSNNTYSLFEKIINDDTLYNDLFQAKSKDDIIQCLSDMAVRIQLPVFSFFLFHSSIRRNLSQRNPRRSQSLQILRRMLKHVGSGMLLTFQMVIQ